MYVVPDPKKKKEKDSDPKKLRFATAAIRSSKRFTKYQTPVCDVVDAIAWIAERSPEEAHTHLLNISQFKHTQTIFFRSIMKELGSQKKSRLSHCKCRDAESPKHGCVMRTRPSDRSG